MNKDYTVCAYTRLSIEDNDLAKNIFKSESGSITMQRTLILNYIKEHTEFDGCNVIEKCDDGFSGTKFEDRPAFSEMISLAKNGTINCIIVKDFSRFGRNYVETGNYLEQLFPFLGVRFISINDNYDSDKLAEGETGGLDMAFKNLIYDLYSRELSNKLRNTWKRMAKQGQYISPCALYGYKKSKDDKHKLIIEPEEAAIVREIFDMKLAGMGAMQIARILNDRDVPTPCELYQSRGCQRRWKGKHKKSYWVTSTIEHILKEEKYTGTMVQLKTTIDGIRGKQKKLPKEDWIRVENTHEPIVTIQEYTRASSSIKNKKSPVKKNIKNIYYCGVCGFALSNLHYGSLMCKHRNLRTNSECSNISIPEREADTVVLEAIKKVAEIFLKRDKLSKQIIDKNSALTVGKRIELVTNSIESAQKSWMALYDKYADGRLKKELFIAEKKEYDENIKILESELDALYLLQEREGNCKRYEETLDEAMMFLNDEKLTENMKEKFIDKVFVYPGNKFEIIWKFDLNNNLPDV